MTEFDTIVNRLKGQAISNPETKRFIDMACESEESMSCFLTAATFIFIANPFALVVMNAMVAVDLDSKVKRQ